ncbi:SRPBCC family protein [Aquihabitans sp. McL0605]|uniref:SRPBCC family protein n=1 Tax=Aquihabitans sp. McL0605 TaxID=3415671 RepID=UPI003CF6EF13
MATFIPETIDFAETAPVIAEAVGLVSGTPQEVWTSILDYPRWTQWMGSLKDCRATSEPATGIGSTRQVTLTGGLKFQERFIAWDEPNVWAFTGTEGPPIFERLVERITIREVSPGRSQVTYRMAMKPRRGLTPVLKVARKGIEKNLAASLAALDGVVAADRAAASTDGA